MNQETKSKRRHFCSTLAFSASAGSLSPCFAGSGKEHAADVVIIGGGLGGCAAAIATLRNGLKVVMTEATDWIGRQLTSQGVPPDEHRWIETAGANRSYGDLRSRTRQHYRKHYPLTEAARKKPRLNPGNGDRNGQKRGRVQLLARVMEKLHTRCQDSFREEKWKKKSWGRPRKPERES